MKLLKSLKKCLKMGKNNYTIGDALVVLFSNPLFYLALMIGAIFMGIGIGGCG
mgnify:CR=1 FL=1